MVSQDENHLSHTVTLELTAAALFGARLRQMRLSRSLSLRSFAKSVGVSEAYLSLVERGRMGPPSVEIAARMARVLDTQVDLFLAGAGRLSPDIVAIILERPVEMGRLIRFAGAWDEVQWAKLASVAIEHI